MTDFIIMVKNTSHMMITGPDVIKTVTHEDVTAEELGGAMAHASKSGVADFAVGSEEECIQVIRNLLSFIPQNNLEDAPFVPTEDPVDRMDPALRTLVPDQPTQPYDMKELIKLSVDDGNFFEVGSLHGKNMVTGFARYGGRSVGIVANQPAHLAGVLDIDASKKGARFVRFCDAFNLPIITFVDVPGFLPGVAQEHGGIIKHGAKLLYAFCEATVPRITIITRKAYGGAYVVMSSKHTRADINLAYPTAELAVMGPDGAVNIVFRKELAEAEDPAAKRLELEAEYRENFANPYKAAELGYIDDVIRPEETRPRIIDALGLLANKRDANPPKKHGNIPL
jgi:propionyl-CoA carboxylase beta chain